MNEPARQRRGFRFSLFTLLMAVAALCAGIAWLCWRIEIGREHRALYARLQARQFGLDDCPAMRGYNSELELYWCQVKAALGYETIYMAYVDVNSADSLKGCKTDLVALRTLYPEVQVMGNFRGCGQLIDIDSLPP